MSVSKNLDFCGANWTERLFSLFSLIFELFLPCHQFEKLQKVTDVGARLQVHNGVKVIQQSKSFHVFLTSVMLVQMSKNIIFFQNFVAFSENIFFYKFRMTLTSLLGVIKSVIK